MKQKLETLIAEVEAIKPTSDHLTIAAGHLRSVIAKLDDHAAFLERQKASAAVAPAVAAVAAVTNRPSAIRA